MPRYDYKCDACNHAMTDFLKSIKAPHPTTCPKCNQESLRQSYDNYNAHVEYKGSGWMKTTGRY